MHVWRNVILTGKRLIRQEIRTGHQEAGHDLQNTVFAHGGAQGKPYLHHSNIFDKSLICIMSLCNVLRVEILFVLGIGPSSNLKSSRQKAAKIQKGFFKYVFVSRNTWILGRLKHIETTLIVLPKTIIEAIKGIINIMSSHNPNQCL